MGMPNLPSQKKLENQLHFHKRVHCNVLYIIKNIYKYNVNSIVWWYVHASLTFLEEMTMPPALHKRDLRIV